MNNKEFLDSHLDQVTRGIYAIEKETLDQVIQTIKDAIKRGKRIYVAGNGGSAAIAEHLCCDFTKCSESKVTSLVSNTSLNTAFANDYGFEKVIALQIKRLCNINDILILISSSGESRNIIEAVNAAKQKKMKIIGLSGFSGGFLKEKSTISLHIPSDNYGVVEDCHQMLMHVISKLL